TQTTDELALRQGCLDRQRKGLTAITRLLAEADAKTIERADAMVASLPSPDACADVQALRRVPLPADTATREAVDAIRDTLGEIRALRAAGRYEQALPLSRDARARADETQYLPVVAEALLMEAELVGYSDNRVKAEALLHQAARAATEARHDEVLAEIWLDLARHMSIAQSQHEQAWRWAGYAEAVINRLGRPPWFRAQLLCTQGNLLWASQKSAEALPRLQSCLELRRADSPDSSLIAATLTHIGNAQIDLGQHEDAERSFRRALDLATASRGPKHPQVAISHNGLGVAYYMQGRLADAEAQYQAAYDLNLELLGPDNPELLYSMGNVANCRRERGQYALALASMRKVEALVRRAFPPEHREVGTTLHNIAELLALQDEPEQALDHYQRALPIRTKVHGATSRWVGNTLTGQGEVLLALGRNRRALESLERAMEARTADAAGRRVDHGRTRFALARALERTGGDMARAQRLVETAREDFTEVDGALDEQRRDAIVAWLAAHAPKP
ncbi:MAG: tetratricopeptide repeat protein, partial [Deltaproteobacteria bacterium]|nr:tetratricopeptide repeat protein [Deltaproteobacteria bacterium]